MSIRKTYQSLHYQELDTYVLINGQKRLVKFRGGTLRPKINGKISTDDPELIAALDKAKGNGVSFACILTEGEAPKTEKKVKEQEKDPEPEPEETKVPEETPPLPDNKLTEVLEVTNLQEAKEFLVGAVEGLKPSQMPNAKSVLNQALKNNFSFPNLKQ